MKIVKYADGATSRPKENIVMINSAQIFYNGPVKLVAGGVDAADAQNDVIYGICKGFIVPGGLTPIDQAAAELYEDGTLTTTSYTAGSDNQTDELIRAVVEPLVSGDVIRAEADAALGTTTGSDVVGYSIDVLTTNETKLDESEAHSTDGQFIIVAIPDVAGAFLDIKVKAASAQI